MCTTLHRFCFYYVCFIFYYVDMLKTFLADLKNLSHVVDKAVMFLKKENITN